MIIINLIKKPFKLFVILSIKIFEKIIIKVLKIFSMRIIFQREDRIGHQIGNFECDLYESIKLKERKIKTIFIFYETHDLISNIYARELIFKVLDSKNINYFKCRNIFLSKIIKIFINYFEDDFYLKKLSSAISKKLTYPLFDGLLNNLIIKDLGLKQKKYVCIYNRESQYLAEKYPGVDFSYHNHRDANINNLKELSNYIISNYGFSVIRVGSNTLKKISWEQKGHPLIFDYSKSDLRSDENDINLISQCSLYINNGGGPFSIAEAAKSEVITINQIPIFESPQSKLWLPKLIRYSDTKKYLTINEMINLNIHTRLDNNILKNLSLYAEENNSLDLLDFIKDYFKLLENNFSLEDKKLISKYQRFLISKGLHKLYSKPLSGIIAPSFLKKYPLLISD